MIKLPAYQILQDKGEFYIAMNERGEWWDTPPFHRFATLAEAEAKIAEWEAEDLAARQELEAASWH